MRIKRGTVHARKRSRLLKRVKGYRWRRKNTVRQAHTAILKAGANARRDRRRKKGDFRTLWQIQISAAAKQRGISYSKFMGALAKKNIELDRKVLADLAQNEPKVFEAILKAVS